MFHFTRFHGIGSRFFAVRCCVLRRAEIENIFIQIFFTGKTKSNIKEKPLWMVEQEICEQLNYIEDWSEVCRSFHRETFDAGTCTQYCNKQKVIFPRCLNPQCCKSYEARLLLNRNICLMSFHRLALIGNFHFRLVKENFHVVISHQFSFSFPLSIIHKLENCQTDTSCQLFRVYKV